MVSGFAIANFHGPFALKEQYWIKEHLAEYFQGFQFTANYGQGDSTLTLEWKVSDKRKADPLPPYNAHSEK